GQCLASGGDDLAGEERCTVSGERCSGRHESAGGGRGKRRECRSDVEIGFHRGDLSAMWWGCGPGLRVLPWKKRMLRLPRRGFKKPGPHGPLGRLKPTRRAPNNLPR